MLGNLDAPAPPSKHWSRKKRLLIALGILLSFVSAILSHDSKLEPYEDLIPPVVRVADAGTNGYLFLKERWVKLHHKFDADERKAWEMMQGTKPWDPALFEKSRASRENLIAELKTALAMPEYTAPPEFTPIPDEPDPPYKTSFITSWIDKPLTDLSWQMAGLIREGNHAAALDLMMDWHQLSTRHIHGSATTNSLFDGSKILTEAATQACEWLGKSAPGEAQVSTLAERWQAEPNLRPPWKRALLNETAHLRENWDTFKKLQWKSPMAREKLEAFVLKKNQTLNFIHQERRQLIAAGFRFFPSLADAQAVGWGPPEKKHFTFSYRFDITNLSKLFLPPHAWWSTISGLMNRSLFLPRALQVRIAIYRWRLKHPGQWPDNLEELVPEYLPEIPADPWNGKALTWDPTTHVILAVGSDWKLDPPRFYKDRGWFSEYPESPGFRCEIPPAAPGTAPAVSGPKAPIPPTE